MRKQFKKVLSMVLSAAMTLSLASGVSLATNKSAGAEEKEWVAVDYTAAKLSFDYSGEEQAPTIFDGKADVVTVGGKFNLSGANTIDVYAKMKEAFTGNVGWMKGDKSYTVSGASLVLTTAKGDVTFDFGTKVAEWNKDKKKYEVDFPNIWGADKEGIVYATDNARLITKDNALALEVVKEEQPPQQSGTPVTSGGSTTSGGGTITTPEPSSEPGSKATIPPEPASFNSYIAWASNGWGTGYWGTDKDLEDGKKATTATVTGPGKYTVGLDFTETEDGCTSGLNFVGLMISDAEMYHNDRIIRVDEIKVNGTALDKAIVDKAYTCSDADADPYPGSPQQEGVDAGKRQLHTRVNMYGASDAMTPENEASRKEARNYSGVLNADTVSAFLLEDYANEDIKTIEVSYTYGTKAEIDKVDEDAKATPEPQQTKDPGTTSTQKPGGGTTATQKPGGTTPTKAPEAGLTNGTTVKVGGATYKVTDAKALAVEITAGKKNAASVTIPATVKVNGKSCKVTSIKAKAFSGNKKLKSVVIGKNIKTIGKQAFFKCAKLKKVTFKGTAVKKIGAKAFAKTNKKMTVTVPKKIKKKVLKSYKKILKKSGISKKAKYKKK